MTEKKYHVVFSGDIVEGEAIPSVKERMAALFKTSAASIESMFNRKNSVIKRDVDEETAQKYVTMIKRTGAICRVIPAEPPQESVARQPVAPAPKTQRDPIPEPRMEAIEKKAEHTGPLVVAIHLIHKGELSFAPLVINKISGSKGTLNFNKMDVPETSFQQLIALAVYNEVEAGSEKSKLLLFATTSKRPLACNAEHIDYASFSIDGSKSTIASFRTFLYSLCRQNPSIFVEESTFDFLSGSPIQKLDQAKILKLSTNMGKLIESGEMAAQT
jgi:hypothetical protein